MMLGMQTTQLDSIQSAHLEHLASYLRSTDEPRRISNDVIALVIALLVLPLALLLIPPALG
jgi:hypothetical protein